MANRRMTQFFYTNHAMPVLIDCNFAVGATGAVSDLKGTGVTSVTRLAAGIYKVKLADNYFKFYGAKASFKAPTSGSGVALASITPGLVYQITSLGTSTAAQWITAGLPRGITAAVGQTFLAAATSGGTGEGQLLTTSGIVNVEVLGDTNTQLGPIGVGNQGGYVVLKCLGATATADTALVAADPASGSRMFIELYLSNSSVVVSGE